MLDPGRGPPIDAGAPLSDAKSGGLVLRRHPEETTEIHEMFLCRRALHERRRAPLGLQFGDVHGRLCMRWRAGGGTRWSPSGTSNWSCYGGSKKWRARSTGRLRTCEASSIELSTSVCYGTANGQSRGAWRTPLLTAGRAARAARKGAAMGHHPSDDEASVVRGAPRTDAARVRRGGSPESAGERTEADRRRVENWESEGGATASPRPPGHASDEGAPCDDGSSSSRSSPTA